MLHLAWFLTDVLRHHNLGETLQRYSLISLIPNKPAVTGQLSLPFKRLSPAYRPRQRPGIVARGHGLAVCPGGTDGDEIAATAAVDGKALPEHVGTLADGAYHIIQLFRLVGREVLNPVEGMVKRRANEVVHAGIEYRELAGKAVLYIQHPGNQRAAGSDDAPPELEMHLLPRGQFQVPGEGAEVAFEIGYGQMVRMLVVDSQSPAYIDVADRQAVAPEPRCDAVHAVAKRHEIGHVQDLRPYVEMQAAIAHVLHSQNLPQHPFHLFVENAELVLRQARGDVGVGVRAYIGIHADAHRRHGPHLPGQGVYHLQFGHRLHVEAGNSEREPQADVLIGLPHPGEHYPLGGEACLEGL